MYFININFATNKFLSDKQPNLNMNGIVRESIQTYDKYAKLYADFTSEKIFMEEDFEIIHSTTSDDNGTQWVEVFARKK